jgi:hypothetical protein
MDVTLASEYWGQDEAGQPNTSVASRYYIFRSVHIYKNIITFYRQIFTILFYDTSFFFLLAGKEICKSVLRHNIQHSLSFLPFARDFSFMAPETENYKISWN